MVDSHSWQGKNLKVEVLCSVAGIAQHIWISNEKGSLLIDAGDGILGDLLSNELDLDTLKGVIFTHGHFDHMGGLHSLLGYLRMIDRKELLPIFAPEKCIEVFSIVENFKKCYSETIPFKISCKEVESFKVFQIAEMSIQSYPVVHSGSIEGSGILDPIPALGYKISYEGESIAISGDTGYSSDLKELVRGVDLAIIEATYRKSNQVSKEYLEKVHLSEDLAREIGKLAKDFILVHRGKCN
ncbi:MAG: MBL fold metallo-hydrolase [candidate division Zixibacteria bacterium]|nr:MBL fold metallo-hydrolase [candidate division Zixibacteria bacterium]